MQTDFQQLLGGLTRSFALTKKLLRAKIDKNKKRVAEMKRKTQFSLERFEKKEKEHKSDG